MTILSILIAITIPGLFLFIIWNLEVYAMSRTSLLFGAIIWGAVAFMIALGIQTALFRSQILTIDEIRLLSAPFLEEILKACLFIVLAQCMMLRYTVDGTAYGFAIGTGFAIIENLFYVSRFSNGTLDVVIARMFSTSLLHAFTTAVVGTVIGYSSYQSTRVRVGRVFPAIITAIIVHSLFNLVATRVFGWQLMLMAMGIGLGGTGIVIWTIRYALRSEKQSIDRALADNVGAGERAAALNPQELAKFLSEHSDVIDAEHAQIVQDYIVLKAQQGILQKTLTFNQRHKYRATLQRHLETTELQIEELRRAMGLYTWIWLRTIFPSDESAIWANLDVELNTDHPALDLLVKLNTNREHITPEELQTRVNLLRDSNLFNQLDDDDLEDVALSLIEQNFSLGDVVIEQGAVVNNLYCVASGYLVDAIANTEGRGTVLQEFTRGGVFGQLSMLDMQPHPSAVYCMQRAKVYFLPREDFVTLIYAKPQTALQMMHKVVQTTRQNTDRLVAEQHGYPMITPFYAEDVFGEGLLAAS